MFMDCVAQRQNSPGSLRRLQASLHCDRQSRRWDLAAILATVAAALIPALKLDESLSAGIQYAFTALVAALFARKSVWLERGRLLRNAFEYRAYGLNMPYPAYVDDAQISEWDAKYRRRPTNERTTDWFEATPTGPPEDVRDAQLSSLGFGTKTRIIWAVSLIVLSLSLVVIYLRLSPKLAFADALSALSLAALIATVTMMAKISHTAFQHSRSRKSLTREIQQYGGDYAEVAATFQERINSVRSSRVIVPNLIYKLVRMFER